jgi:membrane associated rhomboid family serine protease
MSDPTTPGLDDAPAPASLPRRWEELFPRRPKPDDVPFGFLSERGNAVPGSREKLLHLARTRSLPSLVWTSETSEMVPPWEVPFLLEVLRESAAADARRELRRVQGALAVVVGLSVPLAVLYPLPALAVGVVIGGLLWVIMRRMERRVAEAQGLTATDLQRGADAWVERQVEAAQPIPTTRRLGSVIIAVGITQILMKDASIDAGAVSREAVAAGEWWRLFTAPMLHGGILHFWMNYGALESLGRTVETRAVRAYVPLVFLAAALVGGLCSILLPPDAPSVGASGGLMGMFGFLAVMAWRRKQHLPQGFLRGLLINLGIIGLVGLFAYQFIDNAAHAGGLLAGLLIGFAAVPPGEADWTETRGLRRAGVVAQAAIYGSAALAIGLTLLHALT